jgi:hypothetical protein
MQYALTTHPAVENDLLGQPLRKAKPPVSTFIANPSNKRIETTEQPFSARIYAFQAARMIT